METGESFTGLEGVKEGLQGKLNMNCVHNKHVNANNKSAKVRVRNGPCYKMKLPKNLVRPKISAFARPLFNPGLPTLNAMTYVQILSAVWSTAELSPFPPSRIIVYSYLIVPISDCTVTVKSYHPTSPCFLREGSVINQNHSQHLPQCFALNLSSIKVYCE